MQNLNTNFIQTYADAPEKFKEELELDDQLSYVADIILFWDNSESDMMEAHGKSSIEAKRAHDKSKYWTNLSQILKKQAELEIARLRQGL